MRWLVLVTLLITFAASSQEHPDGKSTEGQKTSKRSKQGTYDNPLSIKIIPEPDAKSKAEKDEKYREAKSKEDGFIAKSTVWLAAWTTVLAIFTILLWLATKRLVIDAGKTANRQLRAYVFVDGLGISAFGIGNTPEATLTLKNFGQTPAYNVRVLAVITVVKKASELAEFLAKAQMPIVDPVQIGPGGSVYPSCEFGGAITDSGFSQLKNNSVTLYFHGRIDYTDIFNQPHWATFRTAQDGKGAPVGSNKLIVCDEGNDADRD